MTMTMPAQKKTFEFSENMNEYLHFVTMTVTMTTTMTMSMTMTMADAVSIFKNTITLCNDAFVVCFERMPMLIISKDSVLLNDKMCNV